MSQSGGGAIVNISSINAIRGYRGVAAYAGAKAGLDGFGRSLARELGPFGIRVNSVVPGFFDTAMTAASPNATANASPGVPRSAGSPRWPRSSRPFIFLCSSQSSFITGQTLVVDGGISC